MGTELVKSGMLTAQDLIERRKAIHDIQKSVMKDGIDYGVIPGCGNKPTLLKPGAETLNVTFGLRPVLNPAVDIVETMLEGGHREYRVAVHIMDSSDREVATGVGCCSTMETKYRYRSAQLKCPKCGKETVIKGRAEYGGGYLCFAKKGGCGAKFKDDDSAITGQDAGQVENNPADNYNTCLKMGKKRGLIDGTINATAASHTFTQDIEDMAKEVLNAEYVEEKTVTQPRQVEPEAEPEITPEMVEETFGTAPSQPDYTPSEKNAPSIANLRKILKKKTGSDDKYLEIVKAHGKNGDIEVMRELANAVNKGESNA